MTSRTRLLSNDRVELTFTSPLEWSRTMPGQLWTAGYWRSRRYGVTHVRFMGFELAVYR